MPLHAVTYIYADRPDDLDAARSQHREFLRGLHARGVVVASGPYTDHPAGQPDAALLILDAPSPDDVARFLDDDPFATAGLVAERIIREWKVVIGAVGGAA